MILSSGRIWRQVLGRHRAFSSSARRLDNFAFIGLGQMGSGMARNLQSKLSPGDNLRIFDINTGAMEKLAEQLRTQQAGGAAVASAASVEEASSEADTVITCLPEPQHVQSAFASILEGDLSARPHPRLYIDCSTVDPATSRSVAALVAGKGGSFVDAPMSGGVVGAKAGTLTFMVGGCDASEELAGRVETVLRRMGARVLHCGPSGSGIAAKLANNYLLAIQNIATAEAMNLGVRQGLDPRALAAVINSSTGRCWASEANNPVPGVVETAPASRDYVGGFGIQLMRKDLRLAMSAAREAGARLELGTKASEVYGKTANMDGCQGRDFSVVYRWLGGKE